jgi:hypothetical protein
VEKQALRRAADPSAHGRGNVVSDFSRTNVAAFRRKKRFYVRDFCSTGSTVGTANTATSSRLISDFRRNRRGTPLASSVDEELAIMSRMVAELATKSDLATKVDLAELKAELIKWNVGAMAVLTAIFAAIVRLG